MNANIEFQHVPYLKIAKDDEFGPLDTKWLDDLEYMMGHPDAMQYVEEFFSQYRDFSDFYERNYEDIGDSDGVSELLAALNRNPNAIDFLKANPDCIAWDSLSENPNAMELLNEYYNSIDWKTRNPTNDDRLQNYDDRCWNALSKNPNAIHLLEQHPERISWHGLSSNPNAIHLLEQHPGRITWHRLSRNPNAIHLMEQHPERVSWCMLKQNPDAIHLMVANLEQIKSETPFLLYDYAKITAERMKLNTELKYHPYFIQQWLEAGNELEEYN